MPGSGVSPFPYTSLRGRLSGLPHFIVRRLRFASGECQHQDYLDPDPEITKHFLTVLLTY